MIRLDVIIREYKPATASTEPRSTQRRWRRNRQWKGKTQENMKLWQLREKVFPWEGSDPVLVTEEEWWVATGLSNPHMEYLGGGRDKAQNIWREKWVCAKFPFISRVFIFINTLSKWKFSPVKNILDIAVKTIINIGYLFAFLCEWCKIEFIRVPMFVGYKPAAIIQTMKVTLCQVVCFMYPKYQ